MTSVPRGARRLEAVQPAIIPIIGDLAARTPGTLSLGQGVVGYPPPPEAFEALNEFLADREGHKYGEVEGSPALRDAIRSKLEHHNRIVIGPGSRIVVTAGANMAFVHAILAITDPGDEVILLTPFYFNHDMAVAMAGCGVVAVATDDHFQPDLDRLRRAITPRTRAIVTVTPNNPTGAVYPEASLRAINRLCAERGLYHLCDEVYEYFTWGEARHFSPASIPGAEQHTISMFSLSKSYGMAGWRVGYMVVPDRLAGALSKIQDTVLVCPPGASQAAALGALRAGREYCLVRQAGIERARRAALDRLNSIAGLCTVVPPDGAFYLFIRVQTTRGSQEIAERLVREYRIATVPGNAFGPVDGCYLRVGFGALDERTLDEGLGRLVTGIRAVAG